MYPKAVRRICLLTCCCCLELVSEGFADVLTFDYTGAVVLDGGTVFGIPIATAVPVSGQLVVDTTVPSTHDLGDGRIGYRQSSPGGFTANFGSGASALHVAADEYLAVIGNDTLDGNADSVEFLFATDLLPPLASPLLMNGLAFQRGDYNRDGVADNLDYTEWNSQYGSLGGSADGNFNDVVDAADYTVWRDGGPAGIFSIVFVADPGLFASSSLSGAALATNLNPVNFFSIFNFVAYDANASTTFVFFDLYDFSLRSAATSLVPEPSGPFLLAAAAALLLLPIRSVSR